MASALDRFAAFYSAHQVCSGVVTSTNAASGFVEVTPATQIGDRLWKTELRCKGCGGVAVIQMTEEDVQLDAERRADALVRTANPEQLLELLRSAKWEANLRQQLAESPAVKEQIGRELEQARKAEQKH